ncbi:conjugal transfer protein TraD [Aureimonas pseudogalii]|uniref:conjugal transfer protein TraD n=1 Tax=Aureimonas pseudogalii TaxID=1744844 RepID=UPI00160698E9|nr:conjugal transfer protein TraD [Aureimonas pseudogalii]
MQRALRRAEAWPAADARRKDAHEKIGLGGLVVKAGLREADKAFILGVLVDAASRMSDGEYRARMTDLGRRNFGQ